VFRCNDFRGPRAPRLGNRVGEPVAIKALHPELAVSVGAERFLRESRRDRPRPRQVARAALADRRGDGRDIAAVRRARVTRAGLRVAASVLCLTACQPQARRLLLLDLALAPPAAVSGTAEPWHAAGYRVEYRRYYPHLARSDVGRYRTLVFLLGREPEAPSDALTGGDAALLSEWVRGGGVVVLGYDADGEGRFDRSTANRWLAFEGAGIAIGDEVLEDTTAALATPAGDRPPWAEAQPIGGGPLGAVYEAFPLERNHALTARERSQILARSSRRAFVRTPRGTASRPAAGIVAAARLGEGLVVVMSRQALGALGPQLRPSQAPVLRPDALARTRAFLVALARWTRRPAEWAHLPAGGHRAALTLARGAAAGDLAPPPLTPPPGADTVALPLQVPRGLTRGASVPDWLRQQGLRVLWAPALDPRSRRPAPRSGTALDSLVMLLDGGGFNLLAGDAAAERTDSVHAHPGERAAVRRAWADLVDRLEPTSVSWIPMWTYESARWTGSDSSRGPRGEALPSACALDSVLWTTGLAPAYDALIWLAAKERTLVVGLGLDLRGAGAYAPAQDFCDAAWRHGLARLGRRGPLDALPYAARYPALRDAGLLGGYYRALEDEVAARAAVLRDRALKERRDLYFAFRLPQPSADWFTLGLLRGFALPDRPLLVLTPEARSREVLAAWRARGLSVAHAVELAPAFFRAGEGRLRRLAFGENDGFWLEPPEAATAAARGGPWAPDSLARAIRRLAR
jgi:hypothetical protein